MNLGAQLVQPENVQTVDRADESKVARRACAQSEKMLNSSSLLWICYFKGKSKIKTDINRDTLHAYARTIGLDGVSLISIDDDWSAMGFKVK